MKWKAPGWSEGWPNRVRDCHDMHSRRPARDVYVTGILVWMRVPCKLTCPGSWISRVGFEACTHTRIIGTNRRGEQWQDNRLNKPPKYGVCLTWRAGQVNPMFLTGVSNRPTRNGRTSLSGTCRGVPVKPCLRLPELGLFSPSRGRLGVPHSTGCFGGARFGAGPGVLAFHPISCQPQPLLEIPAITYLPAHTTYTSSRIPSFTRSPQRANGAMGRVRPDGQRRSNCTSHPREVTSSSAK